MTEENPNGLPWRIAPWGDGSTPTGNSNILSDGWGVVIAMELPTETAQFIVDSVNTRHMTTQEETEALEPKCPFCGSDPFHYVDNGVGMEAVAVTCCELGDIYFRGARPEPEQVTLSWEEFGEIGTRLLSSSKAARGMREALEEAETALKEWRTFGCPQCGGDCAAANPNPMWCIMKIGENALNKISALSPNRPLAEEEK